jgi:hypothetical protein
MVGEMLLEIHIPISYSAWFFLLRPKTALTAACFIFPASLFRSLHFYFPKSLVDQLLHLLYDEVCLYAPSIWFLGTSGHFISIGFSFLRVCESVKCLGSFLNILL